MSCSSGITQEPSGVVVCVKPVRNSGEEQGRKDFEGRTALVVGKKRVMEAEVREEDRRRLEGEVNSVCHTT